MNDKNRESLSAFLDGEMTNPEVLESLVRQSGCNKAFAAMCEQRDAMHGQLNCHLPVDFADNVAQAVAAEPAILSPAAGRAVALTPATTEKAQVVRGRFPVRAPSVAIAASVAALGFVGLVMLSESAKQPDTSYVAKAPVSNSPSFSLPSVAVAPDLSVRQDAVRPVTSDVRSIDFNALSPQLRAQLIQHIEAGRRAQSPAQPSNISFQPGN